MSQLVITIISIALTAIAALMGVWYAGGISNSSWAQATANSLIAQSQQLNSAGVLYSSDHGGADYSTFGISDMINSHYLSSWPELGNMSPAPDTGNISTGRYDKGCYNQNGYQGAFWRTLCVSGAQSMVVVYMKLNDPYNGTCTSQNAGHGYGLENAAYANHPLIQLCKAINAKATLPGGMVMAASGVPYATVGSVDAGGSAKAGNACHIRQNADGSFPGGYCFLVAPTGATNVAGVELELFN